MSIWTTVSKRLVTYDTSYFGFIIGMHSEVVSSSSLCDRPRIYRMLFYREDLFLLIMIGWKPTLDPVMTKALTPCSSQNL